MQPESFNSLNPPANEKLAQQFHKNILRLALCFRTRSKRVDGLLSRLAKLSAEEKTLHIDGITADLLSEIIVLNENRATLDPLAKFAVKLDSLGLNFASGEKIFQGELTAANAESFAKEIAQRIETPDPTITHVTAFIENLPITEGLKREIRCLQDMVVQDQGRLASLDALTAVVRQLNVQLENVTPGARAPVARTSASLLLELMNLIDFPKALRNSADELRQKLSGADIGTDFGELIKEISGLIEQTRLGLEAEIARLTEFLSSLFSRLERLDVLLVEATNNQNESSVNHGKLQHDFEQQVSTMRDDLANNEDIDQIRDLVSTRIDKLGNTINDYVAHESERLERASAQVSEMSQTVKALESKTAQLNQDLAQQKIQLQTDPLTGILNRSGYQEILANAISRFDNSATKFSLAIFDIDHFKRINDKFGHLAGDKVLQNLAAQVRSEIRASDSLCRYGGEEFVIIMPDTDGPNAQRAMENLRAKVENYHFHHNGTPVPVTISCGTCEYRSGDNAERIFERADGALYRAKNSGRNIALLAG